MASATVNDVLIRVRRKVGDMQKIKYSDSDLIDVVNDSIEMLSMELIDQEEPDMIQSFTLSGTTAYPRPDNFVKFVGNYPVWDNTATTFKHLDSEYSDSMLVRYYALKNSVSTIDDTIPFNKLTQHQALTEKVVKNLGGGGA